MKAYANNIWYLTAGQEAHGLWIARMQVLPIVDASIPFSFFVVSLIPLEDVMNAVEDGIPFEVECPTQIAVGGTRQFQDCI